MSISEKRIKILQKNEIIDLKILLNTTLDVEEFIKNMEKSNSRLK
jgi:hypothetical protein